AKRSTVPGTPRVLRPLRRRASRREPSSTPFLFLYSNYPVLLQRGDFLRRQPKYLAVHVLVVLAHEGRGPARKPAAFDRHLEEFRGKALDWPGADFALRHRDELPALLEVRTAPAAIGRVLSNAARTPPLLKPITQ